MSIKDLISWACLVLVLGPAIIILGTLFKDKKSKKLPTDGAKIKMSQLDSKRDLQDLLDNNDSEKLQNGWRYTIFGKKNTKKINLN